MKESLKQTAIEVMILLPFWLIARGIAAISGAGADSTFLAGWIGGGIGMVTLIIVDKLRERN